VQLDAESKHFKCNENGITGSGNDSNSNSSVSATESILPAKRVDKMQIFTLVDGFIKRKENSLFNGKKMNILL